MQTLHLRLRDLRAISLRRGLSRWQTPSDAIRAGMGGAFALPNPPEPTCSVGWRPVPSRQNPARCPTMGAGLVLASPFREAHIVGPVGAAMCRVCRWQTACDQAHDPAPHKAGDRGPGHRQARASATLRAASPGLSFSIRPQLRGERNGWKKTADRTANVGALARVSSGACRRCERALRPRLRLRSVVR